MEYAVLLPVYCRCWQAPLIAIWHNMKGVGGHLSLRASTPCLEPPLAPRDSVNARAGPHEILGRGYMSDSRATLLGIDPTEP